ncbi:MAG: hypothetical protein GXY43_00835 [Clostridiaceae bacterium]|nr:hypothetical protein [Clostridiaceae bacterium]
MKGKSKQSLIIILLIALICPMVLFGVFSRVNAATAVTIGLNADTDIVEAGDTISVDVVVDTFPRLIRFGPIEMQFDSSSVSFAGMDRGEDMPSTFSIDHSASTGVIAITGVDSTVENQILSNQTAPTADAEGNPISPPEDPSMNRTESTVLCRLYFVVLESSKAELRFWISNAAGFINSSFETLSIHTESPISIPVQTVVSTDAYLSMLEIDGATLSPDFNPMIFEYSASVPRSVTDLVINAVPSSLSSQVYITGNTALTLGENRIRISVLAQDMKTTLEYVVLLTRESSFVPPGAKITDPNGETFLFADFPENLALPSDFYQSEILLNGLKVPAFRMDGMRDVLLYLTSASGETGLYVYSPISGAVLKFNSDDVFFRLSQLLTVVPIPDGIIPPEGFEPDTVLFRGQSVPGYTSADGRTRILYMQDDTGKARFYVVDTKNNDLYPFTAQKKEDTSLFQVLFITFLVLSVAEAAMLAIVIFQVRKRKPRVLNVRRVQ